MCCLVGWVLRLGALADLLSRPVLVGYLAGIAATMAASQLGKLVGVREEASSFLDEVREVFSHLDQVHAPTATLGLATLAVLLTVSYFFPRAPTALIGMLGATAVVAALRPARPRHRRRRRHPGRPARTRAARRGGRRPHRSDRAGRRHRLRRLHRQHPHRPRVRLPPGETVDAQRELLALGGANLGAGLVGGIPVSSSGSRTAIGDAVGQRTQLGGLVDRRAAPSLALLTLRPVLAAFPVAGLAAVVVYAATRLVDVRELVRFGRFRTSELVLALATTVAVLVLDVLLGIVAAIALSVLDLLRRVARPHDAVLGHRARAGRHARRRRLPVGAGRARA